MVELVALLEAPQDRDRVLHRRFGDGHGLESPLERGVLLDVPAVLLGGRGPDAVERSARKRRLQQVRGVQRTALRGTGVDERVKLVDEQDHPALGALDLTKDRLQPLLELAAELRAREERAEVERHDPLLAECLGHVLGGDAQREPFDHRGLADPGVADQHRIVLRPAREDLDHAADLFVPPDHRVELAVPGEHRQVPAVLLERLVLGLLRPASDGAAGPADLFEGSFQGSAPGAELLEQVLGGGRNGEQAQQQLVDRGVPVLAASGFRLRGVEDLGELSREVLVRGRDVVDGRMTGQRLLDPGRESVRRDLHGAEERRGRAVGCRQQRGQQMIRLDRRMPELGGATEGGLEGLSGGIGQPVEMHRATHSGQPI